MKQLKEADNRVIVMKSELQILQPQVIEKAEASLDIFKGFIFWICANHYPILCVLGS